MIIEIPEAYGTVSIYSTLGIKVMEINNPGGRIDVSRLSVGVYYIAIDGRFEKFVKM